MKTYSKNKKIKGYTLVELIFYLAFFSILTTVVINAMLAMTRAFGETIAQTELAQSGTIMETLSRNAKQASSVTCSSAQDCIFKNPDSSTVEFKLVSTDLQFYQGSTLVGNLNTSRIKVVGITIVPVTNTSVSKAVKMVLSVQSLDDPLQRTVIFNDTAVLRGSYAPSS